jgi:hypothetical protein
MTTHGRIIGQAGGRTLESHAMRHADEQDGKFLEALGIWQELTRRQTMFSLRKHSSSKMLAKKITSPSIQGSHGLSMS